MRLAQSARGARHIRCIRPRLQLDPEDPSDSQWEAQDDVHGGALPPELVRAARQKEIQFLQDRKVYSLSTTAEAFRLTRRPPLKLKWIDTNKGDKRLFNIRSRLVCTEIRRKGIEAIFSATPPLESLRALVAKAASRILRNLYCLGGAKLTYFYVSHGPAGILRM